MHAYRPNYHARDSKPVDTIQFDDDRNTTPPSRLQSASPSIGQVQTSFRLDRVVQDLEEWSWLPEYSNAIRALNSIVDEKKDINPAFEGMYYPLE